MPVINFDEDVSQVTPAGEIIVTAPSSGTPFNFDFDSFDFRAMGQFDDYNTLIRYNHEFEIAQITEWNEDFTVSRDTVVPHTQEEWGRHTHDDPAGHIFYEFYNVF